MEADGGRMEREGEQRREERDEEKVIAVDFYIGRRDMYEGKGSRKK